MCLLVPKRKSLPSSISIAACRNSPPFSRSEPIHCSLRACLKNGKGPILRAIRKMNPHMTATFGPSMRTARCRWREADIAHPSVASRKD
jgi:hypothetical protein